MGADQRLKDLIKQSYVLTYKENADRLINILAFEGLNPSEIRATYTEHQMLAPSNTRTFINHHNAWQRAAGQEGYSLICESDFVPCRGLGDMPSFWPSRNILAWGYLYQGSPRILALTGRYLRGHCAPLVAYVINAHVARMMIDFFELHINQRDIKEYYTFDSWLQWHVMGKGAEAYIPRKHYGEHGGVPNREHALHGLPRSGRHRADNLAAALHFLPPYAQGSRLRYLVERAEGRMYGFARLFTNKWIVDTDVYDNGFVEKLKMQAIGFRRLM